MFVNSQIKTNFLLSKEYREFSKLYRDDLMSLFSRQWTEESLYEYGCNHYEVSQYIFTYFLFTLIKSDIYYGNHNWSEIKQKYNLDSIYSKLQCNGIKFEDMLSVFDIELLDFNYVRLKTDCIKIKVYCSTHTIMFNMITSSNPTTVFISWEEGANDVLLPVVLSKDNTIYNLCVYGDLNTISAITINKTADYTVLDVVLPSNLPNLSTIDLSTNDLSAESIDDIMLISHKIAKDNNIFSGSLNLSGNPNYNESITYSTYAECVLKNKYGWSVNTPMSSYINCDNI